MSQTKSLVVLAGAALTMGGAAFAEQAAWSANVDEVRALVAEMMSDAQTRSSLLQSGATAGHDGKFFLASPDGNFRLNIGGQMQFRYYAAFLDSGNDPTVDEFNSGFEMRRAKLTFAGNIFDPNMFYEVTGAFSQSSTTNGNGTATGGGSSFRLENAFFGYDWDNGFTARAGQFKLPFLREELVSSKYQLVIDRSVLNEEFNQGYSQGIEMSYKKDWFGGYLALSDGFSSSNTAFNSIGTNLSDFAITGRIEILLAGDWKQFKEFTSPRGSEFAAMLGAAVHWQQAQDTPGANQPQFLPYTLDISVEGDGWNLFGSFVGQYSDNDIAGPGGFNANDFGFVAQGGIMLTDELELFGRYDIVIPDSDRGPNDQTFNSITAGVNYYIHGQAAKFSVDVVYNIDDTTQSSLGFMGIASSNISTNGVATGGNNGIGMLASTEEGEFTIRAQFQLLF